MSSLIAVSDKWRAQARRKGYKDQTRSFPTKILAEKWSREVERQVDHGRAGQLDWPRPT